MDIKDDDDLPSIKVTNAQFAKYLERLERRESEPPEGLCAILKQRGKWVLAKTLARRFWLWITRVAEPVTKVMTMTGLLLTSVALLLSYFDRGPFPNWAELAFRKAEINEQLRANVSVYSTANVSATTIEDQPAWVVDIVTHVQSLSIAKLDIAALCIGLMVSDMPTVPPHDTIALPRAGDPQNWLRINYVDQAIAVERLLAVPEFLDSCQVPPFDTTKRALGNASLLRAASALRPPTSVDDPLELIGKDEFTRQTTFVTRHPPPFRINFYSRAFIFGEGALDKPPMRYSGSGGGVVSGVERQVRFPPTPGP